jgi:hypothetical protein
MDRTPARTRTLAFLISGLMDCIIGGVLLLACLRIISIPVDADLTQPWVGVLGAGMAVSGAVVFSYQLTKLKEPDE